MHTNNYIPGTMQNMLPALHPETHAVSKRAKKKALMQWFVLWLALAILGGAIGANLFIDYGRTADREQTSLSTQARIVAQNIELQLATCNRMLEELLDDLSIRHISYDAQTGTQYLQAISNAMPGIHSIGIIDSDGIQIASSRPESLGGNFSHLDYFQTTKRQPSSRAMHVSAPYRDPYIPHAITITRAILGSRGEFRGLVYATLDPDYFHSLMASVLSAPDMWNTAIHGDGLVFLSAPKRDPLNGTDLAQAPSFFTAHRDSGKATSILEGKVLNSGNMQIIAQHTIQPANLSMDKPLIIAAGRERAAIFSSWVKAALVHGGLYIFISLIAVLGLYAYQARQREFGQKETLANAALRASEENHRLIVENTMDLVVKLDTDGHFTYVNPAYTKLYGVDLALLRDREHDQDVVDDDKHLADMFFKQLFNPPHAAACNLREKTIEGVRHVHWTAQAILDESGNVTEVICIGRDVTQQIQHMNKLEEQAQRDQLTGLANRRHFMHVAGVEFARAHRYKSPLSLLALDADHFKNINDTYGHQAGDIVLQKFSQIFHEVLREVDIIGRIGGEEFSVLLPETELLSAVAVAERLLDAIVSSKVVLSNGITIRYTASIGVATLSATTDTLSELLNEADRALYQAKNSGRSRVNVAGVSTNVAEGMPLT